MVMNGQEEYVKAERERITEIVSKIDSLDDLGQIYKYARAILEINVIEKGRC